MKTKNVVILTILLFTFIHSPLQSQTVYEPINRDIYSYLSRMAQKGVIDYNDQIKPITRKYIAQKLLEIKQNAYLKMRDKITELEIEELDFYIKDYGYELQFIKNENSNIEKYSSNKFLNSKSKIVGMDSFGRYRLFSYSDDLLKLNLSPILGYQSGTNGGESQTHRWNGVSLFGYLSDNIGFSFDFRDNAENGVNIDRTKNFTQTTGVKLTKNSKEHIEYEEAHVTLSTNWSWGNVTVGKDFLKWGYAESGSVVLSTKAPSFPFVRLDLQPASWLRFNYIHAWLSSDIIDSNETYATRSIGQNRVQFRSKYLSSHTIIITPTKGLDLSLGESIIYSDREEISYLIPFMFFRLADHYLSNNNNNAGDNAQFFLGVSSRGQIKNTHLYSSIFIDEFTLSDLFNSAPRRKQIGITVGASVTDLPIENLTVTTEYTRVQPFTYSHFIPTDTYQSSSYNLGQWVGNNFDLIYGALNYRIKRGLQAKVWGQFIRKAGLRVIDQRFDVPSLPFLVGLRTNYTFFGAEVKYEIIHEFFAKATYKYTKVSKEQPNNTFIGNTRNEFSFAVYYGL